MGIAALAVGLIFASAAAETLGVPGGLLLIVAGGFVLLWAGGFPAPLRPRNLFAFGRASAAGVSARAA